MTYLFRYWLHLFVLKIQGYKNNREFSTKTVYLEHWFFVRESRHPEIYKLALWVEKFNFHFFTHRARKCIHIIFAWGHTCSVTGYTCLSWKYKDIKIIGNSQQRQCAKVLNRQSDCNKNVDKNVILTIYVLHLQNQPLYSVKHLY
jgi:hypothetical protein